LPVQLFEPELADDGDDDDAEFEAVE